jgi:hypothetical protein
MAVNGGVLSSRPASAMTGSALDAALLVAADVQQHALPSHACTALSAAAAQAQAPSPARDASAAAAPPAQALTAAQAALGAYFAACFSADAAAARWRAEHSLTSSTRDGAAPALDTDAYLRVAAALAARHVREREAVDAAAAALSRGFDALHDAPLLEPLHATPCTLTAPTARPSTPHTPALVNEIPLERAAVRMPHLHSPPFASSPPHAGLPAAYSRDVGVRELTLTARGFLTLLSQPAAQRHV